MLVAFVLLSLFYGFGQCQLSIPLYQEDEKLIKCVVDIITKFFEQFELTYVSIHASGEDELLKAIHTTMNFSVISRLATQQMFVTNREYLVHVADAADFVQYFEFLIREPVWNPYAKFLIIVRTLEDEAELNLIFDELLRLHVNDALVVNGTAEAHLYTYNPFDNYACGKYYDKVISYGLCSLTTDNLYPNKLVTGLNNCHFTASLAHRPPFTLDPLKTEDRKTLLGTEEYIMALLAQLDHFTVNFNYSYNGELFSTVAPNMTAIGPLLMLQKNECDIIFGGMMMVATRAEAFTYLCGYHDYSDELRFAVRSASFVPTWKYIYLEFDFKIWLLLLATFGVYSVIVVHLLRSEDSTEVVLRLLDNLLLHGREIRTRLSVKCVIIIWAWFAYLINTFYQSSLFSLTTHPSMEYQVSDEQDMIAFDFKPCFTGALRKYLFSETNRMGTSKDFRNEGCQTSAEAMTTVSANQDMFTLIPNYFYLYNERKYKDEWGRPLIYYFDRPFTKFLFGYYFYKGFPITKSLQLNALGMRESGLADKSLGDHYYARKLQQKFYDKPFETRFVLPWCVFVPGFIISTVTFMLELLTKYTNWLRCINLTI